MVSSVTTQKQALGTTTPAVGESPATTPAPVPTSLVAPEFAAIKTPPSQDAEREALRRIVAHLPIEQKDSAQFAKRAEIQWLQGNDLSLLRPRDSKDPLVFPEAGNRLRQVTDAANTPASKTAEVETLAPKAWERFAKILNRMNL